MKKILTIVLLLFVALTNTQTRIDSLSNAKAMPQTRALYHRLWSMPWYGKGHATDEWWCDAVAPSFREKTPVEGGKSVHSTSAKVHNVKDFGAVGDGQAIDTEAINKAIAYASENHGDTVFLPSGRYACYSIHLKSNVVIKLDKDATIVAAKPDATHGYDQPEFNKDSVYQDFGHSHWHNSLIWGEDLTNVTICGEGMIDGTEVLTRGAGRNRHSKVVTANKALAMKNCKHVTVSGLKFLNCGHFAMLLTGVDNLLIEDVIVDSNRDGIDIDCCEDVTIRRCKVNTLNDDAIVLKCSYALGWAKPTARVLVEDCDVSGYDVGTYMDGTKQTTVTQVPDRDGPTGRIKLGTESSTEFRDITVRNCRFTHCRGLAIETVDGAALENVEFSDITMQDICNSPIYIRLGNRMRSPEGTSPSTINNVRIHNVTVKDADSRYACLIYGMEGNPIRNVSISNLSVEYRGGLTMADFTEQRGRNTFFSSRNENTYPEPSAHGIQPAWGWSLQHVDGLYLNNIKMSLMQPDERPMMFQKDVKNLQEAVAFPGAEGFGMYTTGGRGGKVYHVTSLADDGKKGTLRWAVNQKGPRTIVFDVSGTIFLKKRLRVVEPNLTIAGQTAPGDGICVADMPFTIDASNVIVRYMRFRLGNRLVAHHEGDGFGASKAENIIVDHCSVSWSVDECLSVYGNKNSTVQWCIVDQSLVNAGHSKGSHGYGGNWGGSGASFHHNLIAHCVSRVPRLGPSPVTQEDERMDLRNNVFYNWAGGGCYGGEAMDVNIVNNYYKPGPATDLSPLNVRMRIAKPNIRTTKYCNREVLADGTVTGNVWNRMWHVWGHFFLSGNVNADYPEVARDNWNAPFLDQIVNNENDGTYTAVTRDTICLKRPIFVPYTTTEPATDAYELVLAHAGASLHRDSHDAMIINDVRNRQASYSGISGPGFIDSPNDNRPTDAPADWSPWPTLRSLKAPKDSDGDGMPDAWETKHGLNPKDAMDGALMTLDHQYTNLEIYLNSLVK